MQIGLVDTNILIRFKAKDDPQKAEKVHLLFERVSQGRELITTTEAVLAEVVYVLSSKKMYSLSRQDIKAYIEDFIKLKGLKMRNKKVYLRALELYAMTNLDFVDTLLAAHVEQGNANYLITFDTKIAHISTVKQQAL